jgi:hypothetical protein
MPEAPKIFAARCARPHMGQLNIFLLASRTLIPAEFHGPCFGLCHFGSPYDARQRCSD